jgi:hypothetical protein
VVIIYRYNVKDPTAPRRAFLKHTPNNEGIASDDWSTDRLLDQAHQRCFGLGWLEVAHAISSDTKTKENIGIAAFNAHAA